MRVPLKQKTSARTLLIGKILKQILSPPPIVSFAGPQKRETNGGNETIGGRLKKMEEIGNFLQFFSISTLKMKHLEENGDFRHSYSIKGVKMKIINVNS